MLGTKAAIPHYFTQCLKAETPTASAANTSVTAPTQLVAMVKINRDSPASQNINALYRAGSNVLTLEALGKSASPLKSISGELCLDHTSVLLVLLSFERLS